MGCGLTEYSKRIELKVGLEYYFWDIYICSWGAILQVQWHQMPNGSGA